MGLDMDDQRSPYLQVADAIRAAIRKGEYSPGDRLPTVNELVKRYGVARMTVQRAIEVLREEGYVMSWQGRGTFVRSVDPPAGQQATAEPGPYEAIMQRLDSMQDEIQHLGERLAQLESRQARRRGV